MGLPGMFSAYAPNTPEARSVVRTSGNPDIRLVRKSGSSTRDYAGGAPSGYPIPD
jgi:hypothetical protein